MLLLKEFHETPIGGHAGIQRTYIHLAANFFREGMKRDVKDFVGQCYVCQTVKYSTEKPYGLLQPTELPERVWEDVAMDFIISFPQSRGYTAIFVVVDWYSKYAHFGPLPTAHTALQVAELFCSMVICLHSVPRSIISDRDPLFMSKF